MNSRQYPGLVLCTLVLLLCALPAAVVGSESPREFRQPEFEWVRSLDTDPAQSRHIRMSSFVMGSTPDDIVQAFAECTSEPLGQLCRVELFSDEGPQRTVQLSEYWLDVKEVTVAEYGRCVQVGRCDPLPYFKGAKRFMRPRLPATLVTWKEAQAYCRFRGGRLPTEAEFERAARGLQGRRFPWGNLYNAKASNHGRLGSDRTDASDGFTELAAVGSFKDAARVSGFFDLAGNAEEWVLDRYASEYDPRAVVNPTGPDAVTASGQRVVRGGSYESPAPWLRSASRDGAEPTERRAERGFRCARARPKRAARVKVPD